MRLANEREAGGRRSEREERLEGGGARGRRGCREEEREGEAGGRRSERAEKWTNDLMT